MSSQDHVKVGSVYKHDSKYWIVTDKETGEFPTTYATTISRDRFEALKAKGNEIDRYNR